MMATTMPVSFQKPTTTITTTSSSSATAAERLDLAWLLQGKRSSPAPSGDLSQALAYEGKDIFDAARADDLPTVALMLLCGADVSALELEYYCATALHWASWHDHAFLVGYLLDHGADASVRSKGEEDPCNCNVDATSRLGTAATPLMWAAENNSLRAAAALIERGGADANAVDDLGFSVAFHATAHAAMLHFLAHRGGSNLLASNNAEQLTLLHWASRQGHASAVEYLLEKARWKDVDGRDRRGRSALHYAAMHGHQRVAKLLLAAGASLGLKDADGFTPMRLAGDRHMRALLGSVASCQHATSAAKREQLSALLAHRMGPQIPSGAVAWIQFLSGFTLPNLILILAVQHLPGPLAVLVLLVTISFMSLLTNLVGRTTERNISPAGWYMGALACGSAILVTHVWPPLFAARPGVLWQAWVWSGITAAMVGCFLRVFLGDPGALQPNPEDREILYECAERGVMPDPATYCSTTLTRRPNRSKYCRTTKLLVARFDHYCVWLGNAVGAKNHVFFYAFCVCQLLSQILVYTMVLEYLLQEKRAYGTFQSFCHGIEFWFSDSHELVVIFLLGYNFSALIFVVLMLLLQTRNITRNVLSNEQWFPQRYPWVLQLEGGRVYTLYDHGSITHNVRELLRCTTHERDFTNPMIPDYIRKKIAALHAKMQAAQGISPMAMQQQSQSQSHSSSLVSQTLESLAQAVGQQVPAEEGSVAGGSALGGLSATTTHLLPNMTPTFGSPPAAAPAGAVPGLGESLMPNLLANPAQFQAFQPFQAQTRAKLQSLTPAERQELLQRVMTLGQAGAAGTAAVAAAAPQQCGGHTTTQHHHVPHPVLLPHFAGSPFVRVGAGAAAATPGGVVGACTSPTTTSAPPPPHSSGTAAGSSVDPGRKRD